MSLNRWAKNLLLRLNLNWLDLIHKILSHGHLILHLRSSWNSIQGIAKLLKHLIHHHRIHIWKPSGILRNLRHLIHHGNHRNLIAQIIIHIHRLEISNFALKYLTFSIFRWNSLFNLFLKFGCFFLIIWMLFTGCKPII